MLGRDSLLRQLSDQRGLLLPPLAERLRSRSFAAITVNARSITFITTARAATTAGPVAWIASRRGCSIPRRSIGNRAATARYTLARCRRRLRRRPSGLHLLEALLIHLLWPRSPASRSRRSSGRWSRRSHDGLSRFCRRDRRVSGDAMAGRDAGTCDACRRARIGGGRRSPTCAVPRQLRPEAARPQRSRSKRFALRAIGIRLRSGLAAGKASGTMGKVGREPAAAGPIARTRHGRTPRRTSGAPAAALVVARRRVIVAATPTLAAAAAAAAAPLTAACARRVALEQRQQVAPQLAVAATAAPLRHGAGGAATAVVRSDAPAGGVQGDQRPVSLAPPARAAMPRLLSRRGDQRPRAECKRGKGSEDEGVAPPRRGPGQGRRGRGVARRAPPRRPALVAGNRPANGWRPPQGARRARASR